jgi:hypothetical protein
MPFCRSLRTRCRRRSARKNNDVLWSVGRRAGLLICPANTIYAQWTTVPPYWSVPLLRTASWKETALLTSALRSEQPGVLKQTGAYAIPRTSTTTSYSRASVSNLTDSRAFPLPETASLPAEISGPMDELRHFSSAQELRRDVYSRPFDLDAALLSQASPSLPSSPPSHDGLDLDICTSSSRDILEVCIYTFYDHHASPSSDHIWIIPRLVYAHSPQHRGTSPKTSQWPASGLT